MLRPHRPRLEILIRHRDQIIAAWQRAYPDIDVFENQAIEITGYLPIAVDRLLDELNITEESTR